MDYKNQLDQIQETIEEKKIEKAKLEERKRKLEEEKQELFAQLAEEGLTNEQLNGKIKKLEEEIKRGLIHCQELIGENE